MLNSLITIVFCFVQKFYKKRYIVFESFPDFEGSPGMIYQELIKRGYDKKYKFVWFVGEISQTSPLYRSECLLKNKLTILEKLKKYWILWNTVLIVDSNRYIYKKNKKTFRLHTRHGGTLKKVEKYSCAIGNVDFILSLSDSFADIEATAVYKKTGLNRSQFIPLGYPNNDQLFEPLSENLNRFWTFVTKGKRFHKIIAWMPTYRKSRNGKVVSSEKDFPFSLPLLYSREMLDKLNEVLHKENVLLAIKFHHAQQVIFPESEFSNIVLITQENESQFSISMMDLIKSCDALITDYSSIYYEFLLLNRPLALTIDDYEEYVSGSGFWINYFDWVKGVYLKTIGDMTRFISDVVAGIDVAKEERGRVMRQVYKYQDNHSTQRVVDFLMKNAFL